MLQATARGRSRSIFETSLMVHLYDAVYGSVQDYCGIARGHAVDGRYIPIHHGLSHPEMAANLHTKSPRMPLSTQTGVGAEATKLKRDKRTGRKEDKGSRRTTHGWKELDQQTHRTGKVEAQTENCGKRTCLFEDFLKHISRYLTFEG